MTVPALTADQQVVLTVLHDAAGPLTAAQAAAATAWPGARTFGLAQTRRVLLELHALGLTRQDEHRWSAEAPA